MRKIAFWILVCIALVSCKNEVPEFNQISAFKYLEDQCKFGPRQPGSPEIELCRQYIIDHLKRNGAVIEKQKFKVIVRGVEYEGVNIIAKFYPRVSNRILLAAHYDTRPWADKESNMELHIEPIIGANDAASGVAVLMEIARILRQKQPKNYGVDLVFFDLEDLGSYGSADDWALGSKYFASKYNSSLPDKAILVDMIGDADLQIPMEYYSYNNSPALIKEIWEIAAGKKYKVFKNKIGKPIIDDHIPLLEIGMNIVDLIDFDYKYWHTLEDTPDKCSAESLKMVGQVILEVIYK